MMNRWYRRLRPAGEGRIRLFCFHHAGGGASSYTPWASRVPCGVDLFAVQLPGRENRSSELPFRRMDPLVDALAEELRPVLEPPFAFFGHSMGARVSFALAHRLAELNRPEPDLLLLSGTPAPSVSDWKHAHRLPVDELLGHLTDLGGLPQAILGQPELLSRLLPTLRADLELSEMSPLDFAWRFDRPVLAFAGRDDRLATPPRVEAWREVTTGPFRLHVLPGDHFFNQTSVDTLVAHVARAMSPQLAAESPYASGF